MSLAPDREGDLVKSSKLGNGSVARVRALDLVRTLNKVRALDLVLTLGKGKTERGARKGRRKSTSPAFRKH